MSTIAARAITAATALAEHENLPTGNLSVSSFRTSVYVPSNYSFNSFAAIREVAVWARAFNAEIILSLGSGTADAETNIDLGGERAGVRGSFGTSQAYELGRLLGRPLTRDLSITISADDLLAALDAAEQVPA